MSDLCLINEDRLRRLLTASEADGGIGGRTVVSVTFARNGFVLEFADPDPRDVERKAWARLVLAAGVLGHMEESGGEGEMWAARDEWRAAEKALRDLGVDVDALLEVP